MNNKRQSPRLPLLIPMSVKMTVENQDPVVMKTRNMSDSGVFLENNDNLGLQIGTKLTIKVIEDLQVDNIAAIPATVVRIADDGFALKFELD